MGTDFLAALPLLVAVVALVLLCRWVFGGRGVRTRIARPDYGLLSPVVRVGTVQEAEAIRAELAEHGVRGTVAPAGKGFDPQGVPWPPGSQVILVFPSDVERATDLVAHRPA